MRLSADCKIRIALSLVTLTAPQCETAFRTAGSETTVWAYCPAAALQLSDIGLIKNLSLRVSMLSANGAMWPWWKRMQATQLQMMRFLVSWHCCGPGVATCWRLLFSGTS